MNSMLNAFYARPLVIYLAVMLVVLSTVAGPAEAMFVPGAPLGGSPSAQSGSQARIADLAKIQTALESKVIQQKLMDYGLSPEETMARVNKLSDEQIHQLATHADAVDAGGHGGVGFVAGLVVLAVLVVLLIFLLEGRIRIK